MNLTIKELSVINELLMHKLYVTEVPSPKYKELATIKKKVVDDLKKKAKELGAVKNRRLQIESWVMINGVKGDYFYSEKKDKDLTAIASYYNRKITTQRMVTVTTSNQLPEAKYLTKVTML